MSLAAIGIIARNPALSVQFYGLLGVDFKAVGSPDHLEGATPSGVRILLDSVDLMMRIDPTREVPGGSGVSLCFLQESPAAVNELYEKVLAAGFQGVKEPWNAFWGQRYASLQDPDHNQVDLFAPL